MVKAVIILVWAGCFFINGADAQGLSNRGTDFWTGYGLHQFMEPNGGNSQEMVLYFSAEEAATVTVAIRGRSGATVTQTYPVPANSVVVSSPMPKAGNTDCRLVNAPPSFGGNGGDGLFKSSIHIQSTVPIVAYAHIYGSASSGATMLMPVETWGYAYTSLNSKQTYGGQPPDCFSFAYIVAQHDSTVVDITPSVPTRDGHPAGVTFQAAMQKGEIYQVVGAKKNAADGYELTGTTVKSVANVVGNCYPVALFSGSSRTANPCALGSDGGDNDMQQVFPSQAWGRRYLTAPTCQSRSELLFARNMYKVVVKDATTQVKLNGVLLNNFDPVSHCYYFESATADCIESDKPVLVGQFMSGGPCQQGDRNGDPEMMYLSPIAQGITRTGFYRNTAENITVNYLTMIVPRKGLSSLLIDGSPAYSGAYVHPVDTNYMVVNNRWVAAKAQCVVQCDSPFTAVTYGLGNVESYGYNAGTMINDLSAALNIHNVEDSSAAKETYTCRKTPVRFSLLLEYQPDQLLWELSKLPGISPNADTTMIAPVADSMVVQNGESYYAYSLPRTYEFSDTGTFKLPVTVTSPAIEKCTHTRTYLLDVVVKPNPSARFTFVQTGCIADSVHFTWNAAGTGDHTMRKWQWSVDGAAVDGTDSVAHLFTTAGAHNVRLRVVSTDGCVDDTTAQLTITSKPVAIITAADTAACMGTPFTYTAGVNNTDAGVINRWYWDFGNGGTSTQEAPAAVQYDTFGTYTVSLVVASTATCISDTARQVVTVYARPYTTFTYPAGCLPADNIVHFKSAAIAPDAQSVTGYSWTFGDVNATIGNPNTSSIADPAHTYNSYGTYTVIYQATTVNGCVKDTTVKATFNIRPLLTFGALSPVCESITTPVSVAKGAVGNGVAGTGIYKGAGVDITGQLTPSLAGSGSKRIWYVYSSDAGCTDSISSDITVNPQPVAAFAVNKTNICADSVLTLTDGSRIATGNIATWNWSFGDGSQATNTNNNPFTHSFARTGSFAVKLSVKSDEECVSKDSSVTIVVHALPVAAFDLPAAVCLPGGAAVFTNNTTAAQNEPVNYQWNFGDGAAAFTKDASHVYADSNNYTVVLTAALSYGCTATINKQLKAFYKKPQASFTADHATLCQGTANIFTDASTAPGSTVIGWNWDFADGTTSTQRNPVKTYTKDGHYQVTLVAINAAGCRSDATPDEVIVYPQPVIKAGPSFVVPEGTAVTFQPQVNDSVGVVFAWDPAMYLNNAALLRPTYIAIEDNEFTLTATSKEGGHCTASDKLTVKVLRPVNVPNIFTPNGDGINDTWNITNLSAYPGCTVQIFNRYGQLLYSGAGYSQPWNGAINGKPVPAGTYYYIIDLKNGFGKLTGSVTIIL